MGLLRLLLNLFAPPRRASPYKAQTTAASPPRPSVPVQEPLRRVDELSGQQIIKGRCWVIDGDTIVINRIHIRLTGIDAPELDQPYGQNAKRALMELCRGQLVTAVTDGSVTHDRAVALCHLEDGRDLSAEMVKAGLALDWRKFSGGKYRQLEVPGIRKKLWRVEARHRGAMPPAGPKDQTAAR